MIQQLATVVDRTGSETGAAVTVRCRIRSEPMAGESAGEKTVYLIEDPDGELDERAALALWTDSPSYPKLERTASHVCSALAIDTDAPDESSGTPLQRGEELLVRGVPNRRGGDDAFYLNATSFVIRDPGRLISKSKLRTQERCPREYYLRYVKRVYSGDKFKTEPYERAARFRGDAVHTITEHALEDHLDRFREDTWTYDAVEKFCEDQFESTFGFRQALLILSGAGLDAKDHVVETVERLFTDTEFCDRVREADSVGVERFLSNDYGYAGRVDILLDGVPYDIKTTRDPDADSVSRHERQIKLYLLALLLERLDAGDRLRDAVARGQFGYLVYPNVSEGNVQFEEVQLRLADIREFLRARNDVIETGDAFAPPSTYNRECEGCSFAVEEWVSGPQDTLPPACTYHCQNERRWPCYETDGDTLTTDCSLFDDCEQRIQFRDPNVIDHFEGVRAAFETERQARSTARTALDRFDDGLLAEAGYRIPSLRCVGARAAGTIVEFETSDHVVPAFEPGETVSLSLSTGGTDDEAVYVGRDDGIYLFSPVGSGVDVTRYLGTGSWEATYTFSPGAIDRRHLPYLDFAQRRNGGDPLVGTAGTDGGESPNLTTPEAVTQVLDNERVFVDLPVGTARDEKLRTIVHSLVTAPYPQLGGDGVVPQEARRALVLGATPRLARLATAAQPAGDHYRIDGTGGPNTIRSEDGYHEIQSRLLDSRSLVSTVQVAAGAGGPGGIREFFHRVEEGDFGERDHSEAFFDLVVLVGADRLTEPEHHFLGDVADRLVAVGDARRGGPRMLSASASDSGLDGYFGQEFDRYRSFPTDRAISVQVDGEAPPALRHLYDDGPWTAIDGDLRFLDIDGDEETALDTVVLEAMVPAASGGGLRLVFDVTDTTVSPMAAQELFEERLELDATAIREGTTVVLNDRPLYLRSKEPLDGTKSASHRVEIRAVAAELPQFGRALLSNRIAEQIVTEVADEEDPAAVVTPFERHGTRIARRLDDRGVDVPVRRPEDLDGTVAGHTVVSLVTSNDAGIVRPPLSDPDVLYPMLASGRDLTLVGNGATLRSKDLFESLIDAADPYGP